MGSGIAQVFAQAGYEVFLHDLNEEILQRSLRKIKKNMSIIVEEESMSKEERDDALSRINLTTSLEEAVIETDFVTEAISENMVEKKEIFKQLDKYCENDIILASNSSSLPINEIAKVTEKPEKCIVTHWLNPPYYPLGRSCKRN